MNPAHGGWVILLSVIVAMLLSVVTLPEAMPQWLGWLRPNWLLLVVFYWVMAVPHRLGMITAWLIGLFVDALHGELLGVNALILAGLTYVTWSLYERLRMYSRAQQGLVVLLLALAAELVRIAGQLLGGEGVFGVVILLPAVATALAWPLVFVALRWVGRHLEVA